jgi:hypothetical protein
VTRRRLAAVLVVVALVGVAVAVAVVASRGSGDEPSRRGAARESAVPESAVPDAVAPAFVPDKPVQLRSSDRVWRWAPVLRSSLVRARPNESARAVARLTEQTPEKTRNIVLVLGRRTDGAGRIWLRVSVPGPPGRTDGWVLRSQLGGYGLVRTHLVVELRRFRATLLRDGRRVFQAPIGIGKRRWPTPTGRYYIRNKLTTFKSPFYGPLAFGVSARSPTLTDWPGGGFVGIHGTNAPQLLPGAVSHGCIRMRNEDILRLGRLMPVGTPVTIR